MAVLPCFPRSVDVPFSSSPRCFEYFKRVVHIFCSSSPGASKAWQFFKLAATQSIWYSTTVYKGIEFYRKATTRTKVGHEIEKKAQQGRESGLSSAVLVNTFAHTLSQRRYPACFAFGRQPTHTGRVNRTAFGPAASGGDSQESARLASVGDDGVVAIRKLGENSCHRQGHIYM